MSSKKIHQMSKQEIEALNENARLLQTMSKKAYHELLDLIEKQEEEIKNIVIQNEKIIREFILKNQRTPKR